MSEKDFQDSILQLARLSGWLVYHTYDSRRSSPGFPDVVMVRGNTLLFVELKSEKGKVSNEQGQWLEALSKVEQVSTYLWKPANWQAIERRLKAQPKKRPQTLKVDTENFSLSFDDFSFNFEDDFSFKIEDIDLS